MNDWTNDWTTWPTWHVTELDRLDLCNWTKEWRTEQLNYWPTWPVQLNYLTDLNHRTTELDLAWGEEGLTYIKGKYCTHTHLPRGKRFRVGFEANIGNQYLNIDSKYWSILQIFVCTYFIIYIYFLPLISITNYIDSLLTPAIAS